MGSEMCIRDRFQTRQGADEMNVSGNDCSMLSAHGLHSKANDSRQLHYIKYYIILYSCNLIILVQQHFAMLNFYYTWMGCFWVLESHVAAVVAKKTRIEYCSIVNAHAPLLMNINNISADMFSDILELMASDIFINNNMSADIS